jgi:hypothetical protein
LADASFTAEKTGQSERKIQRDAQRGEEIGAPLRFRDITKLFEEMKGQA